MGYWKKLPKFLTNTANQQPAPNTTWLNGVGETCRSVPLHLNILLPMK
jgi:hypothetical protein